MISNERKSTRLGAMADRKKESTPSFTRILCRHLLCPADMPACVAFSLFMRVSSDPLVQALKPRAVVPKTNQLGVYAAVAGALDSMTEKQLAALRDRLESQPLKEFR
jgi:hypothetical protein